MQEQPVLLEEDGFEDEILVEEEPTVVNAMWGGIGGNIENQTDLQNALDAKQDSLTEAQLNAVNSGITSEKVTTYDGYADQIASKADQSALNAEATTRSEADTALGTRIDNEALARQNADNGLQTQIDAITSQSDVVDVVANYAALQAYDTSSLSDNDVIKVLDDETHEDALTYYRWSTATQTWSYIGQEAPYYSKGQMDVMLQGKQDTLTAGANIQIQNGTISATDTKYTAGNGLNLNGTEFSADTDVLATKEDLEDYYTKTEADNLLAPKLEAEVAAELPTTGEEGKLYLTPKAHTTQTATGNPITATVAEEAGSMESFQLDGDTTQQTYTGKNLLNTYGFTVNNGAGLTVTIENDGSLTLNGTLTSAYNIRVDSTSTFAPLVGQQMTYSVATTGTGHWNNFGLKNPNSSISGNVSPVTPTSTVTLTASSTGGYYGDLYIASSGDNVFSNYNIKIQIELGESASDYEPYVGGTPSPNPEYPQPIQTVTGEQAVEVAGKNLFNNEAIPYIARRAYGTDGSVQSWSGYVGTGEYQPVEPSTEYTLWNNKISNTTYLCEYDENKNFIRRTVEATTFTTTATTRYLRWSLSVGSGEVPPTQTQLEKGPTATAYEPYRTPRTYPISLGAIELCKLGTYQDYIYKDGDDWKVHKATGKYIFDGSETPTVNTSSTNTTRCLMNNLLSSDSLAKPEDSGYGASNYFIYGVVWSSDEQGIYANNRAVVFRGNKTTIGTTLAEVQTWLAANKPILYYALATATDTVITDTALIAQLEAIRTASLENGANTITNNATGSNLAGDMEIGYYGYNPTNRYDKWLWLDINNDYEQIGS